MALWWVDERFDYPITSNKDECREVNSRLVRDYVRDSMNFKSKHIERVKRIFEHGATHAIMKGGETNAN